RHSVVGPQAHRPRRFQPGDAPRSRAAHDRRQFASEPVTATARQRADVVARLIEVGVIPVLRAPSSEIAIRVAETLVDAGLLVIEMTMTVPGALDAIATLTRRMGARAVIGAGTVTDDRTVERAVDA